MSAPAAAAKIDPAVQKCIGALTGAKNDTEKMAALFLVTKVVKGSKLKADERNALFEAIGFKFLLRLLVSPSTPECPAVLYKSVALTILTTFCSDPKVAESKDMLDAIPIFLGIIEKADEEGDEEDDQLLQVVREAYHCLKSVASVDKGKEALVTSGAIPRLCELFANQAFNSDEALQIIGTVGIKLKSKTWAKSTESFADTMDRLTLQFETDQSEQKFEICGLMAGIIPTTNISTEEFYTKFWPAAILKGLVDILSSKITEKQRNPALRLASVMLSTLGVDWIIKKTEQGPEAYQFLVLLVHLSCIEVRMALEGRSLDKVMANDDLIGGCYSIIETTVRFMAGTHFENLDEKQKEQVFHSLKGAYWAVLGFINQIQNEAMKNPRKFWDARKKLLTCASIRCLAAWLADEASSMKEDVYKVLPFMLALAFETLQDDEDGLSPENQVLAEVGKCIEPIMPEVLVTLLPALCNFTAEERGVHMIMDSEGEQHLSRFLNHNWSVYKNLKEILEKKSRPKIAEVMVREMDVPAGSAKKITDTFLRRFRRCPENIRVPLDEWRVSLWAEALGDDYDELVEDIYPRWKKLRYRNMALSETNLNMLRHLHKEYQLALVTNGPSNSQWEKIRELKLQEHFDAIVVSGDLKFEKPAPEIFLRACKILGVEPYECLMIGDKLETDIVGGLGAELGITVWVYDNEEGQKAPQPPPDFTIPDVSELVQILQGGKDKNKAAKNLRAKKNSTSGASGASSSSSQGVGGGSPTNPAVASTSAAGGSSKSAGTAGEDD